MNITGIICEYNPLHLGHQKQLKLVRQADPSGGIVCIMSGSFVQRGKPAVFDKLTRARAAVLSGADLVLELPVTAALQSAEGFAAEGVRHLHGFCHQLCFGAETGTADSLMTTAKVLLSEAFQIRLKAALEEGLSFPAARQKALGTALTNPNDILGVEYCKAILSQGSTMKPVVIRREGSYHDTAPDEKNPSATALRLAMAEDGDWLSYVPAEAQEAFAGAQPHCLEAGERGMLARLRTMTDGEFEALPFGAEGLWRKLMQESRRQATLEDILTAVKSKRYTRSRLDRMVMCAFLGLTAKDLETPSPYARALALNDRGREILKTARQTGWYPNTGETVDHSYQQIENRCESLYGLFAEGTPGSANQAQRDRLYYQP